MTPGGNAKLGPSIWSWSIPAQQTCPGATAACLRSCYARRGHYVWPATLSRHQANWERSKAADFASAVTSELRYYRVSVCRLHCAGDFPDAAYARKWLAIVRKSPRTTFFAYTRSFTVPAIRSVLKRMALEPNMRLFYSMDSSNRLIVPRDPGVCIAYMLGSGEDEENVPEDADLVFRTRRATRQKRVNGILVCPHENGVKLQRGPMTCTTCRICFSGYLHCRRNAHCSEAKGT